GEEGNKNAREIYRRRVFRRCPDRSVAESVPPALPGHDERNCSHDDRVADQDSPLAPAQYRGTTYADLTTRPAVCIRRGIVQAPYKFVSTRGTEHCHPRAQATRGAVARSEGIASGSVDIGGLGTLQQQAVERSWREQKKA